VLKQQQIQKSQCLRRETNKLFVFIVFVVGGADNRRLWASGASKPKIDKNKHFYGTGGAKKNKTKKPQVLKKRPQTKKF
jgi:hypothetical protein